MKLPDMNRPAADAAESRLTYTEGSARTVFATEVEVPFPEGRLIVSRTDLDGLITHANDAFVELSGWLREELIGMPHHILRHPDMPKAAFKGLWDTVAEGKKWHGYVKNLRKDGACLLGLCNGGSQHPPGEDCGLHLGSPQAIAHAHRRAASCACGSKAASATSRTWGWRIRA